MTTVFSPRDLATRWQVSKRHVLNLARSGRLPSFKVGGKLIRISAEAVEEFEKCASPSPGSITAPPGEKTAPSAARRFVPNVVSLPDRTLPRIAAPSINDGGPRRAAQEAKSKEK